MINVFQPRLGQDELAALREVFQSNWIGRGSQTEAFHAEFAAHLGVNSNNIGTTNSCTEALFQIMQIIAEGASEPAEVILPTVSFVGAANAILGAGMNVVFCDVDRFDGNATVSSVETALTDRTRAVLVQHQGGNPSDIQGIAALCRERNVLLVEDAAAAVASKVDGQSVGTFGDFAAWSLDSMKMIAAGDGGVFYARDVNSVLEFERNTYLGLTSHSGVASTASDRWWNFDVDRPGRRSIMNDITAAIARTQLAALSQQLESRRQNAETYREALADLQHVVTLPGELPSGFSSSEYFFAIQVDPDMRDHLATFLRSKEVYTTFRYEPLHTKNLYGQQTRLFPGAEFYSQCTLMLPQHGSLTRNDVETVSALIHDFFRQVK